MKYKLKQDSYYTSNGYGCDCCPDDRNEIWEITRIHPTWGEMPVHTNGTPHSLEDCYEAILIDAGIDLEIEWEDGN